MYYLRALRVVDTHGTNYFEELAIDKNNIRLERLDNGIPFLKDHDSRSIDNVLGKSN